MIITSSRALATKCWRKAFNHYHRDIEGPRAMALTDGTAMHAAIAHGLATREWATALEVARPQFDADADRADIPEEQAYLREDHWQMCTALVNLFAENFAAEPYQVVQPECMFDVALPGTEHNDITLHHSIIPADWPRTPGSPDMPTRWGMPPADAILQRRVVSPHARPDPTCPCWQPHRVVGRTDCLLLWERNLWLQDTKTTAIRGEMFWQQWELDLQFTLYLYGIWKTLNILPRGVIVSALYKPTEKQVAAWNSKRSNPATAMQVKDYLGYERRAILRTREDLERIEWVMAAIADEWEHRILTGDFRPALMRGVCNEYNRECEFATACKNHEEDGSFAGVVAREPRYDDQIIAERLVQITNPRLAAGQVTKGGTL